MNRSDTAEHNCKSEKGEGMEREDKAINNLHYFINFSVLATESQNWDATSSKLK